MAKKKSNSKAQDAENVVSSDDTTIKNDANVNEHDDAVSDSQDAPETQDAPEKQDAHETPGVGDGSEIQDSDVTETLCAEGGEAICDEVHRTTGKILHDEDHYIDDQMMGRLRASVLTTIELYREAQIFGSQSFNIASMVTSNEPCLVQNTLEIARILNIWVAESIDVLTAGDARSRDIASQYILSCMKSGVAPAVEAVNRVVENFAASSGKEREYISVFLERLRILLMNLTAQDREEPSELQRALSRLCHCFDIQTVERMMCDPDASVRIAVVRSLASRDEISSNTLLVALILLKDRNEAVNEAVVKLCAKLKSYPELVLPQVLPLLPSAGRTLRESIGDLLRSYAERAVEPVMSALEDTRETMFDAVVQVIALSPQRYTDALLVALQSVRTREFVRTRIAQILHHHKDPSRQEDISIALGLYEKKDSDEEYPQWVPAKAPVEYAPSATDDVEFYQRFLTDDELEAFSKTCDESAVLRLMSDASEFAQINAMKVARIRGEASAVALETIAVWLRCENSALAQTAADTWFAVHPDKVAAVNVILDALQRVSLHEIQKYYLEKIKDDPALVDALFAIYYERPRLASPVVRYVLSHDPSQRAIDSMCAGIEREKTVACIAETLELLLKYSDLCDNRKLRPTLMSLLKDPVSFGQYGLVARLRAIALLQKFLVADGEQHRDRETIAALQGVYKSSKNSDIRYRIKELLKAIGEEVFDFDDEEDDFEDLNDDE